MLEATLLKDRSRVDLLIEHLTQLEEQKDELLVKITFLRELLEVQEDQLKSVRSQEDAIASELSVSQREFIAAA